MEFVKIKQIINFQRYSYQVTILKLNSLLNCHFVNFISPTIWPQIYEGVWYAALLSISTQHPVLLVTWCVLECMGMLASV